MKIFVLAGGDINSAKNEKIAYYKFLSNNITGSNVLVIPFARSEYDWQKILDNTIEELSKYRQDFKIYLASKKSRVFKEQVEHSNLIIIKGGSTSKLIKALVSLGFKELNLDEKLITGSSAGAYILANKYYSLVENRVKNGLGLLNYNLLVHYMSPSYETVDWGAAVDSLGNKNPLILLPEQTYCIITS